MTRPRLRFGEHYSTATLDRRTSSLRVWEFVHAPDAWIPEHRHERAHVVVLLAGGFVQHEGGASTRFAIGDAMMHPRGCVHANSIDGQGARTLAIEFEADFLPRAFPDGIARFGSNLTLKVAARDAAERVRRSAGRDCAEALERAVCSLLSRFVANSDSPPDWIEALKIELNRRAEASSIHTLAQTVGRHPAHMMREFRRYVGVPIGEYIRARRVLKSCDALRDPRSQLSHIAAAHGFADQSHFARTFSRFMNMTPDEYRKLIGRSRQA